MAAERDFAAPAERGAMDGRDNGLEGGLDRVDHLREHRHDRWPGEFGDVGASEECASVATNDDGLHRVIGERRLDPRIEPDADSGTERVHWRVVADDDEDVVMDFSRDGAVAHFFSPKGQPIRAE